MDGGRVWIRKQYGGRGRYGMVGWVGGGGSYVSMFRMVSKILLGNTLYHYL